MTFLRRYGAVTRMGLKTQLQYASNLLGRALVYAMLIFMFTRLWAYLYGQNGQATMAGYTLTQMLWYLVMTELTWFSARPYSIRGEIAADIRGGRIAYLINKPYDYTGYVLSKYFGEAAFNYSFNILIAIAIGLLMAGPLPGFDFCTLPMLAVTFALSSSVSCYIYLALALVSFWVEENAPFIWIYEKFMLVLGILFPIEIFPVWAQPIIRLSPIYPTVYAPAKMTVDFSTAAWLTVTGVQLIWLAALALLTRFIFKKGERKLHVNGG